MVQGKMSTEEEQPWLIVDELDQEIIVGNRQGLERLRNKINQILEGSEDGPQIDVQDSSIGKVVLESKSTYLGEVEQYKATILQTIMGYLLSIWFVVLPFVAIALIAYLMFFKAQPEPVRSFTPVPNCIKYGNPFEP